MELIDNFSVILDEAYEKSKTFFPKVIENFFGRIIIELPTTSGEIYYIDRYKTKDMGPPIGLSTIHRWFSINRRRKGLGGQLKSLLFSDQILKTQQNPEILNDDRYRFKLSVGVYDKEKFPIIKKHFEEFEEQYPEVNVAISL